MFTGGCQCGALRYRAHAAQRTVFCFYDHRLATDPSGLCVMVSIPAQAFRMDMGTARIRHEPGSRLAIADCPGCGIWIWRQTEPAGPMLSINGATVDGGVEMTGAKFLMTAGGAG